MFYAKSHLRDDYAQHLSKNKIYEIILIDMKLKFRNLYLMLHQLYEAHRYNYKTKLNYNKIAN